MMGTTLILAFFWSLFISLFAIPSIIDLAHSKNLLDEPGERSSHKLLTPRLGGIAIFAGFFSAITVFGTFTEGIQYLLAGCVLLFFLGIRDDLKEVKIYKKILVQALASFILIFVAGIRITSLYGIFGVYELNPIISYVFTFIIIIGITNAINLIDGIDGLSGVIVTTICFAFGILLLDKFPALSLVAFALAGSVIGFLRYNLKNAKVFMGDTGSLISGFAIVYIALKFLEKSNDSNAPVLAIAILIVPVFDTIRVIIYRIYKGRSPFQADKNHIHHKLLRLGFNQLQIVGLIFISNLIIIIIVVILPPVNNNLILGILFILLIITGVTLELALKKNVNEQQPV